MLRSLRHAGRRLARARGFSAAATLTLALGLAATTTVFAAVNAVLLRPLPYPEADRLVSPSHTLVVGTTMRVEQSDASLLFYARHARAFSAFGGYRAAAAALGPLGGADAERLPAALVTAGVFGALGVPPLAGRLLTAADEQRGQPAVAVLSERLWRRKFGGEAGLLNRRIEIDGLAHEVVGILPATVRFPAADTDVWLPLRLDAAKTDSATFDYQAVARLADGVTLDRAASDLDALLPQLPAEFPGRMTAASIQQTRMHASVRTLEAVVVGDSGPLLWLLLGATGLVLVIACANVANLFLVRAEGRRSTLALQRALGAGLPAMVADSASEVAIVGVAGGALGLVVASAGVAGTRLLGQSIDLPRSAEVTIDAGVVAVVGLLTAVAVLFIAGVSLLRSGAASPSLTALTGRAATIGRDRRRAQQGLVAAQVALALVLLAGAGLMARSMWRLSAVEPGFDPAHALAFRLALPAAAYANADDTVRFFTRAADSFAAIPSVRAAAAVSKLPLDELGRTDTAVFVEDRPLAPGTLPGIHPAVYATPGYFDAAGIPLLSGRRFTLPAPPDVSLEVVVSHAFADRYWKNESPIGRRLRILINGPWYTIVGVAGNVRDAALDRPADEMVYCPLLPPARDARWTPRDVAFIVRTAGEPAGVTSVVRDVVRGLDRSLPLYRIRTLPAVVADASARRWFTFVLIGGASLVALLLGAIGLYGVMSYVVALRTREIGIRLALGADPRQLRRMVSRQGLAVAAIGVAAGLGAAIVLTRSLSALLFEVSPTDPAVLGVAATMLLGVAAAASWLPARRAAAVDPACTLRAE